MEANPAERQYNAIWAELKLKSSARITAPRALHRRIIKAVQKEKWLDIAYKIQIEPKKATLWHSRSGGVVSFTMTFSLTAEDF